MFADVLLWGICFGVVCFAGGVCLIVLVALDVRGGGFWL